MDIRSTGRSERGLVRKNNEDCVLALERLSVFAVADGMGGGAEGERASRMVCEELSHGIASKGYLERLDEIGRAVDAANGKIRSYALEHGFRQMGSTVAILAIDAADGGRGAIGYIGDSRVYRLRAGEAQLLTRDHSVGAELEAKVGPAAGGRFAERSNPLAHILTRVVGVDPTVDLEWRKIDVAAGDRFVVCSDGVHDVIGRDEMGRLVGTGDLPSAAEALACEVERRGAPDNYSFVIVETGGAA